ncbi:MAG: hypothetical protein F4X44_03645 [Gammaproteobacteria bacterium]|nr:hypothetical protein [Gammaproteobacteria bacterium]MYD79688.1 hypothetical protein [Gammaproteobacteria bacterium]
MSRFAITSMVCLATLIALTGSVVAQGVKVGPQPVPQQPANVDVTETKGFLKTRMNIPSLRLAIPVLDPGIPASSKEQHDKGIWPELRRSESVWAAFKLKEWMHRYNQFDEIIVCADSSVSADLYLIGKILKSDGETMSIEYSVIDATGSVWFADETDTYRVEIGWHQRNEGSDKDPFDPLYNKIAETVYEALKDRGKAHVKNLEKSSRNNQNQGHSLSDLERIELTRDLAFARFLSPEEFGDSIVASNGRYQIQYIPSRGGPDWTRIESIQTREDAFLEVVEKYYSQFVEDIGDEYHQWQLDSFPIAREIRIAKRNRAIQGVAGTVLLVASVAAAADGAADDGDSSAELGTKVGAAIGGSLIVSSFMQNARRKAAVDEINELGGSLHNSLKPTRVDLNGKVVTLSGTVHDQFTQWRAMLTEMYENSSDADAITILDDEAASE